MTLTKSILALVCVLCVTACDQTKVKPNSDPVKAETEPTKNAESVGNDESQLFRAEVWGDNWSSMYVGENLVMEDSVSITTERSFNEEVFEFKAKRPFLLNVVMKDFVENESGLEYIGSKKQQMGDGGYIAQIKDASGKLVAVSNSDWKCLTINTAPLDKACEKSSNPMQDCKWRIVDEPSGWKSAAFDDSDWTNATIHPTSAVSPKHGYDKVKWDPSAKLIWGADLEIENTILCRVRVK